MRRLRSWALLTAQIASGPFDSLAEVFRKREATFDLAIPLVLGGIAMHQLWHGIWRQRRIALAIGAIVWVLIGYTTAVLFWEI